VDASNCAATPTGSLSEPFARKLAERTELSVYKYKWDMFTAPAGHPQPLIRAAYPTATHLTPESLYDCWTFRMPHEIQDPPPHVQRMRDTWLPEEGPPPN
jgi:hypothetical protein